MRVSELIATLQAVQAKHGDLPVYSDGEDGLFELDTLLHRVRVTDLEGEDGELFDVVLIGV